MKKVLLGVALATAGFVGQANAATVYADSIVSFDQNGTVASLDRSDPEAVKGPADGIFYSLGIGGNLVLDFGAGVRVNTPGLVSEVTFKLAGYFERMSIFVSKSLVFSDPAVATISNQTAGLPGGAALTFVSDSFRYVKLVDFSTSGVARDGFDLDSISFTEVPVPASGLLMGAALFGLGAMRRRNKKA
jgi:hypothetical protein